MQWAPGWDDACVTEGERPRHAGVFIFKQNFPSAGC